jgi:hypothetical protein
MQLLWGIATEVESFTEHCSVPTASTAYTCSENERFRPFFFRHFIGLDGWPQSGWRRMEMISCVSWRNAPGWGRIVGTPTAVEFIHYC